MPRNPRQPVSKTRKVARRALKAILPKSVNRALVRQALKMRLERETLRLENERLPALNKRRDEKSARMQELMTVRKKLPGMENKLGLAEVQRLLYEIDDELPRLRNSYGKIGAAIATEAGKLDRKKKVLARLKPEKKK